MPVLQKIGLEHIKTHKDDDYSDESLSTRLAPGVWRERTINQDSSNTIEIMPEPASNVELKVIKQPENPFESIFKDT